MSDEELIARLRDGCNLQQRDGERAVARIVALKAKLAKAVEALQGSRETILQLVNCRGSEAEGTDEEWVSEIDAALAKIKEASNG